MSVVGDRLYSMGAEGDKDCVYAIDLKTQKKLWSVEVGTLYRDAYGDGPRGTPTIDGNFLYAIGGAWRLGLCGDDQREEGLVAGDENEPGRGRAC